MSGGLAYASVVRRHREKSAHGVGLRFQIERATCAASRRSEFLQRSPNEVDLLVLLLPKRWAGGGPEIELSFGDARRVSSVKCYYTQ